MNYPNSSGYVRHSETSAASAAQLDASGRAASHEAIILERLVAAGSCGATANEMRKYLQSVGQHAHNGSVNARMSTLWRQEKIIKTKLTRVTDAGKSAHVYAHVDWRREFAAAGLLAADYAQVVKSGNDAPCRQIAIMLLQALVPQCDGGAGIRLSPIEVGIINRLAAEAGLNERKRP